MQRRPFFSNPERKHTIKQLSVPGDPLIYSKCGKKFEDDWYRDVHYLQEHSASGPFPNPPEVDGLKDAGNHDGLLGKGKHILPTRRYCEEPESYAEGREYGPRRIITMAPYDNHRTVVTRYSQSSLTDPGPLNKTILQPSSYSGGSSVNQTIFEGYPNHTLDSRYSQDSLIFPRIYDESIIQPTSEFEGSYNNIPMSSGALGSPTYSIDSRYPPGSVVAPRSYNEVMTQTYYGYRGSPYRNTLNPRRDSLDSLRTRRDSRDDFSNQNPFADARVYNRTIQSSTGNETSSYGNTPILRPNSFDSLRTRRDSMDGFSNQGSFTYPGSQNKDMVQTPCDYGGHHYRNTPDSNYESKGSRGSLDSVRTRGILWIRDILKVHSTRV